MKDNTASLLLASVIATWTSFGFAQAPSQSPDQPNTSESMPQFPASNVLLQAALNDLSRCVDATVANSAKAASKSVSADTVMSQCTTEQAKLQQMIPPDAFEKGMTNTKQRVTGALANQRSTTDSQ